VTQTSFGHPLGGVFQIAYTVPDLEQAMRDHADVERYRALAPRWASPTGSPAGAGSCTWTPRATCPG
jgi:hypothetical protein